MASGTISSKCAINEDRNSAPVDCVDSRINSTDRDNIEMTKSWSPIVRKQINNVKSRCCSANRLTRDEQMRADKKSLYRTYSSYGFKNLKKDDNHSRWSMFESNISNDWNDDKSERNCMQKKYQLADFQRCLKLLGLNLNSQTEMEQHRKTPNTKKVKPKIVTRLTESTVSLNDIQDAVLNDFEKNNIFDSRNRSFLAQAVYEKWYFNKLQEQKKQQRESEIKNQLMRMEFEKMRCEQKLKAEKSYREWMLKKKDQNSSTPKSVTNERTKKNTERKFIQKSPEKEYNKWKNTKNEEFLKKRKQWKDQKQREAEEKQRRKTEAEKAYQAWQNKINEELKKKLQKEKKAINEKKEEENKSKAEKEKEAIVSFNAWKQNKFHQLKDIQNKQKFESKLKAEARTQRMTERLYEAEQAFYEWLNSVDKRINLTK